MYALATTTNRLHFYLPSLISLTDASSFFFHPSMDRFDCIFFISANSAGSMLFIMRG